MYYEQDWVMRQIEMLAQFIARTVFHKDYIEYEIVDETNLSPSDLLYKKLASLIRGGKICEAEDLLFENLDTKNLEYLRLAVDFYQTVNDLSEAELEAYNFSRQEVREGLEEIMEKFGIPATILQSIL